MRMRIVGIHNGYARIDHLNWNAYNECEDLVLHVENYKNQYGYYPYRVPGDKIYLNRANRNKMKELGIEIVGVALGRPSKESKTPQYKKELKKAAGERNEVEGCFGTAKRRYDMNNIRARLSCTAESWIAVGFFVLNLQRFLKGLLFALKLALRYGRSKLYDTVLGPIRNYINRISQQREFVNYFGC